MSPTRNSPRYRDAGKPVGWTFLSNHAHVLVCLAAAPDARLRDVAAAVGITERAVQKILADLVAGGVVTKRRQGRRNEYAIDRKAPLRHGLEAHADVGALLRLMQAGDPDKARLD